MIIAAEALKLSICPICHEGKKILTLLCCPPAYDCRVCGTRWGSVHNITLKDGQEIKIPENGIINIII